MINSQSDTKKNKQISFPENTLQQQEDEVKSLIANIESQNLVLDKLTIAIEAALEQKLKNTKTANK